MIIFNPLPQTHTHTHHTLHPLPMSLPRLHRPYGGDFSYQAAAVSHLWPRSDRPPWGFSRWLCSGPEPPSPLRSEYIPWLENTAWMRYRYRDPRQKCKGNRWFFNENLVRGNNAGRYSLFFPSLLVNFLLFFFWAVPSILLRSLCVFSFALWAAPSLSLSSRRHGTVTAFKIKDPLCLIHSAETTRWSHRRLVVSRAWFSVVCPYVRPSVRPRSVCLLFFCR